MMKRKRIILIFVITAAVACGLRLLQGTSSARLPDRYGQPGEPSRLLEAALAYTDTHPKYKSAYYASGYPDDGYGTCVDVVGIALRDCGYDLQQRVDDAGLEILEVRITHLAYAEEIAAAMLQRQQASAIIAARQKIVDGAVGMVKMAIDKLGEDQVVLLDEERKAAMVSNLLVVLCGSKDAQPIVNSGSIY